MAHILFDIGGTKMRVARKISETEFSEPLKVETPKEGAEGIKVLLELARDIAGEENIESICGGIAAVLREKKIVNSSNLTGWIGVDFEHVAQKEGFSIIVKNDASVVGLGEAVFGAGRERRIVAYVTVSTGVGGARIVDEKIDVSVFGFEPGHQFLDIENSRTLEDLVSGRGFEARYHKKPHEVEEERIWSEAAHILAFGLYNTIVHWSPDVLVLGGPMIIGSPSIPLSEVRSGLSRITNIFSDLPEIRKAELEDDGGLYGALTLSRQT
jgi:predicted NBD/HSP70 family sugar kinase